jgi:hypothetical protein
LNLVDFLKTCCDVASKGVFLTSLFSSGWIEQETKAYDLNDGWRGKYRVYSLPRLERIVGAISPDAKVEYRKFNIDIDLPEPEQTKFQTYIKTLADGSRVQISGYLLLPWYEIYINLPKI